MRAPDSESVLVRLYGRAVNRLPPDFRARYGDEMVRALALLLAAERQRRGRAATFLLWGRAMIDLRRTSARLRPEGASQRWWHGLPADIGTAFRQVRRRPGFAAAAVSSVALSVGAVTAVFTLADPMLFRPLPSPDADRLVTISVRGEGTLGYANVPDFLRAEADPAFESVMDVGLADGASGFLVEGGDLLVASGITAGFFRTLRVSPLLGRSFTPDEYAARRPRVAIISHSLWQGWFGGRADILEQPLVLEGNERQVYDIVGVLPPDFVFPDVTNPPPPFLVPYAPDRERLSDPRIRIGIIARLAPGVTLEQAGDRMQVIVSGVERDFPAIARGRRVVITPLQEALFGPAAPVLLILLAATGGVFALAGVNLAHLGLSGFMGRTRELATRAALGASPWRIMRQVLVEAGVLAAAGGLAALALAKWLVAAILALTPERWHVYRLLGATVDWRVILFSAGLVGIVLVGFGLLPAVRATKVDLRASLRSEFPRRRWLSLRNDALIAGLQSAVVVGLLVTGLLAGRSFLHAALKPLGFDPSGVHAIWITWPRDTQASAARLFEAQRAVVMSLERVIGSPLAVSEGMPALTLPFRVVRAGQPTDAQAEIIGYPVNRDFFDVFRITLVRGRLPTSEEAFSDAPVAVLDERAARQLFPGEEPLGQVVAEASGKRQWQVVGLVQPLHTNPLRDVGRPTAFVPLQADSGRTWMLRYREPGAPTLDTVRGIVHAIEPRALVGLGPASDPIARHLEQPRFLAVLLGTLAALAAVLAVVGLSGVVGHGVALRRREMGIRLALGADTNRIFRSILGQALRPALAGAAFGLACASWASGLLQNLFYGIEPDDPATYAAAALGVVLVTTLAALGPAIRAARVDPRETMQLE